MKIIVYKGFDEDFLERVEGTPLIEGHISDKKNVLLFGKKNRKKLEMALLGLEDADSVWITYEEYSLIKKRIDEAIEEDGLKLIIYRNNLFPDYYPVEFKMDEDIVREIIDTLNGEENTSQSESCENFTAIYNSLVNADGVLYAGFYNFEYENAENITVVDFYPQNITIEDSGDQSEYDIFIIISD